MWPCLSSGKIALKVLVLSDKPGKRKCHVDALTTPQGLSSPVPQESQTFSVLCHNVPVPQAAELPACLLSAATCGLNLSWHVVGSAPSTFFREFDPDRLNKRSLYAPITIEKSAAITR
jgi:hypothetical protein